MDKKNGQQVLHLSAGVLSLLVLGLIYGWSIFRRPLQDMFPSWTASDFATGFTLLMCFYAIGGIIAGNLAKRLKPRVTFFFMIVCMAIGFLGASTIHADDASGSLIRLYLTYCLFCGLGTGMGYNVCTTSLIKWFPHNAGFALGTMLMGYGMGSLIMGGIVTSLTSSVGLISTFRIMGIAVTVIFLVCSLFITVPAVTEELPEEKSDSPVVSESEAAAEKSYTPKEALKSSTFWILSAWAVIVSAAFMIVVSNAASIAEYYGAPGIIGMIVAVTNGLSRVVIGTLMDKFGFKFTSLMHNVVCMLASVCMVVGCINGSIAVIIIGLLLSGLGFGGAPTTQMYFLRKKFGPAYYPAIASFAAPGLLVSSVLGSSISGFLQERAPAGAAYTSSVILMLVYCAVSFILAIKLRKDSAF